MSRTRLVLVALSAVFAFGALTAASASAVTFLLALWLWNGGNVVENLNVLSEGELLLEDVKGGLFGEATDVLCSGILTGWVGPESLDEISDVLELVTLTLISTTLLVEPGLACTNVSGCPEPLVWPEELPWVTEVELVEDAGTFFALLLLPHPGATLLGWEIECMGAGNLTDECLTTERAAQLLLPTTTTLGAEFNEAFRELVGDPGMECSRGGAGTGLVLSDAEATIRHETGGELSVSSEGTEV